MRLSSGEVRLLRGIVDRAAPIWERPRAAPDALPPPMPRTKQRIERWRAVLGGRELLERRLRSVAIEPLQLPGILDGLSGGNGLPSWASVLASAFVPHSPVKLGATDSLRGRSQHPPPVAFEEVLRPFVSHGRRTLIRSARGAIRALAPGAFDTLEQELVRHLAFVASLAIGCEYYEFRFARAPLAAFEPLWSRQPPSTRIYDAFVRHMDQGGLASLLCRHPVLARLVAQSVEQWVESSADLCRRFSADFRRLRPFFGWRLERPEAAITHIRPALSDRHHGGRAVAECILATGERVVYKPRSVGHEVAFYGFVEWLNLQNAPLALRAVRALDCGTHGWVESVPSVPCRSEAGVERFSCARGCCWRSFTSSRRPTSIART
jgi:hypothetical protein